MGFLWPVKRSRKISAILLAFSGRENFGANEQKSIVDENREKREREKEKNENGERKKNKKRITMVKMAC